MAITEHDQKYLINLLKKKRETVDPIEQRLKVLEDTLHRCKLRIKLLEMNNPPHRR